MFSIRVDAADVDYQIRLLQQFPDISDRNFKPAMNEAVGRLAREIEPNIPHATERAADTFRQNVSGKGLRLTGRVGWWYASDPWYINVVEHGASAHDINSYAPGAGVYIGKHPGFGARHFMRNADEATRQRNVERFEQARDKTVQAMTVKGGLG